MAPVFTATALLFTATALHTTATALDITAFGVAFEQDPDRLPVGSGAWWRAMDRANRGGNVGGSGSR